LERLNAGFLLHVLSEQSEFGELKTARLVHSMDNWWANCIRNDERAWIRDIIHAVRSGDVVFTGKMYAEALERRKETGSFHQNASI